MYAEFGDKGNGLSSKFLDPRALCAHLDPMPSAAMIPLKNIPEGTKYQRIRASL